MKEMIKKAIKVMAIIGITIVLFSNLAIAEPTAREKVVQEALHALDQSNTNDINKIYAQNTKGNWNWLNAVPNTYNEMKKGYTPTNKETGAVINCFASLWSTSTDDSGCAPFTGIKPVSFYNDIGTYGFYESKGKGMQCKAFVNGVIYGAGQKDITGGNIFIGYGSMLQTEDSRSIRSVRQGDVIFNKNIRETKRYANGNVWYYKDFPYTVTAINSGNPDTGTVTSIHVRDRTGSVATISGSELDKYTISKYTRGIEFAQPADIIFNTKSANGQDHTAVVVKISGGNSNDGTVNSLDVVDSNWCLNDCEEISYHTFSGSTNTKLASMFVYTGVSYYNEKWNPYNPILYRYSDPDSIYNGRVYEIRNDNVGNTYSHWIIDAKVFNDLYYDWNKIINDEKGWNLNHYITGETVVFKDGTLIDKSGTIYEMRNGEKHGFTSWESYVSHGYSANTPKTAITGEQANAIPTGLVMDYKLFTRPDGRVYVIQGNERKHVMDIDAFNIWGFSWNDVIAKSDAIIDSYTDRGELGHARYGTFVGKSSDRSFTYFVSNDANGNTVKRKIANDNVKNYLLKGTAKPTYWLSDTEFNSIPDGEEYKKIQTSYAVIISDPNDCSSCHIEPMTTPTPTPTQPPSPPPQPPPTPDPTTPAPTPTPTPDPLIYDINQDGQPDVADIIIVANHFGELTQAPYPRHDVNQDNIVDIFDLALVSSNIE